MLKALPGCTHCKVLECSQGQLFLQKWQGGPRAAVRSDALLVPTAVATEGCIPLYPVGWCCRNYEHCAEPLHQPGGLSRFLVCLHLFTPKKGFPTACTALLGVSFHLIYDLEPTTGEAISWWFNPERNMHIAFL